MCIVVKRLGLGLGLGTWDGNWGWENGNMGMGKWENGKMGMENREYPYPQSQEYNLTGHPPPITFNHEVMI